MSTKIQHVVDEKSSTPRNGEPWNFDGLLEVCLIPFTIAADKKLPPGARLLWGVIRQYSFENGQCHASDKTLAYALAVSDRQIRRYLRALETAQLLRSTERVGKTPVRELLWDSRFAGKVRKRVDRSVRGAGHIRPGGRTDPSGVYKEYGVFNGVFNGIACGDKKDSSEEQTGLATSKPGRQMTEEEYLREAQRCGWPSYMVERDLERIRRHAARRRVLGNLN